MFESTASAAFAVRTAGAPYPGRVTASAHDVAAVLRSRLPGLPTTKLHKLLYYCQGHHVATFGRPLFRETLSAWDMGPVVGQLWKDEKLNGHVAEPAELTEAELNTVGYVVSRYGGLTARDLVRLTHDETPWQVASRDRAPGESARIDVGVLREFFESEARSDAADDEPVADATEIATWLRGADARRTEPVSPDEPEAIRARLVRGV